MAKLFKHRSGFIVKRIQKTSHGITYAVRLGDAERKIKPYGTVNLTVYRQPQK